MKTRGKLTNRVTCRHLYGPIRSLDNRPIKSHWVNENSYKGAVERNSSPQILFLVSVARMSCISELLSQLTCFLKPMMDVLRKIPCIGYTTAVHITLEINWAYSNTSGKLQTKKRTSTSTPVTDKQDGCRFSRRNLERNRRRRQRAKEVRARNRTTTAKSPPIIVSPRCHSSGEDSTIYVNADGSEDVWYPASW